MSEAPDQPRLEITIVASRDPLFGAMNLAPTDINPFVLSEPEMQALTPARKGVGHEMIMAAHYILTFAESAGPGAAAGVALDRLVDWLWRLGRQEDTRVEMDGLQVECDTKGRIREITVQKLRIKG